MALPYCIPYFDAHCDTLTKFNSLRQSSRNHIDLLRLHHYAPAAQVMAIWAPPGFDGPTAFRRIMLTVERELKENRDLVALCTSVAEADAAAKDDMVAGLWLFAWYSNSAEFQEHLKRSLVMELYKEEIEKTQAMGISVDRGNINKNKGNHNSFW